MGFLSKLFGGDSVSPPAPAEDASRKDDPASHEREKPAASEEAALSPEAAAPERAAAERSDPIDDEPTIVMGATTAFAAPAAEAPHDSKLKRPELPPPPRPAEAQGPPPPRIPTLLGVEAPTTGRYRLAAADDALEGLSPALATDAVVGSKVVVNAAADVVGPRRADTPRTREEVPTVEAVPRRRRAAPVRVGVRSKSLAELEHDSFEDEATNPGVGQQPLVVPIVNDSRRADLRLLADFAVQLALGPVSPAWLSETSMATARLRARASNPSELAPALERLERLLAAAPKRRVEGQVRRELLAALHDLERWLPPPNDLERERERRERLVIEQLLSGVGGLAAEHKRRLFDVVRGSLESLCASGAEALVRDAELPEHHAESLLEGVRGYLDAHAERAPSSIEGAARSLERALDALERSAREFESACDADDAERKRRARKQRAGAVLDVNLLLAELGEEALLTELERCSVTEKTERLRQWLTTAAAER